MSFTTSGSMDLVSFAFESQASYSGDKPLFIDAEDPTLSLSASQTRTFVKQLIAGLQAAGLEQGDAVLVCVPNNYLYVALMLGIVGAGGAFCCANPAYHLDELVHIANIANPRFVIASQDVVPTVVEMCKVKGLPTESVFVLDDVSAAPHSDFSTPTSECDSQLGPTRGLPTRLVSELQNYGESSWVTLETEDASKNTAAIYFPTSGTTGLPKLASLSHYSLITQHQALFADVSYEVVRLACLPLFHIFGAAWALFHPLRRGEAVYIMSRFSLDSYLSNISKYGVTETYMAPPMVHSINRCGKPLNELLSSIQYIGIGGAPIDAAAIKLMRSHLQPGATVTPVWGMTEFGPATLFRWGEHDETGSIGRLMEGYEMKLVDDTGKQILEENQPGELLIRATGIMTGYIGIPMCNEDGWFPTGDIAQVQQEKLYVVGRSKELIKVKGWQVAPAELEAVIIQHPNVADCAVVGVWSADGVTEQPRAYVVPKKAGNENKLGQEIADLVKSRLVSYKRLTGGVLFVDSIPRTPSGKVQRFKLLESTSQRPISWFKLALHTNVQRPAMRLRKKLSTLASAAGRYVRTQVRLRA